MEADIRKLKTRLALVTEARNRKVKKLENIKNLPPERIVFGGKKLYSEKDTVGGAKFVKNKNAGTLQKASDEWKQEFFEKRHQSMVLPGRHTSKYGNFLYLGSLKSWNTVVVPSMQVTDKFFPSYLHKKFPYFDVCLPGSTMLW